MDKRLKKQSKKLFIQILAITVSAWLVASAAYAIIRLNSEKVNIEKNGLRTLSKIVYEVNFNSDANMDVRELSMAMTGCLNVVNDGEHKDYNSQIIIRDVSNNENYNLKLVDTTGKIYAKFGYTTDNPDSSDMDYGYIDRNVLEKLIDKEQYQKISEYLNTKRNDEKYYEIICTKFYMSMDSSFIPKELQIVLTEQDNTWYIDDQPVETFELNPETTMKHEIGDFNLSKGPYSCNKMTRNVIPTEFFLNKINDDIIGSLTKEQINQTSNNNIIQLDLFNYVFLAGEVLNYNVYTFSDGDLTDDNVSLYTITDIPLQLQYAKRVNILESCINDLLIGFAVLLGFFSVIAAIIFVMMRKMLKNQLIFEQKRIDVTNAMAHDIKTPLFIIGGYAQSLKENINNEKKYYFADKIIEQTNEVNTLVHNMLNLGKLDSCNIKLNRTDFDLFELIEEICINYVLLPDNKDITVAHMGNNIINADRELIKSAIENLIDNSVKYSAKNSEIKIEVYDRVLTISNNCESITKSDLKQIWQPYVRKDKNHRQDGNGLGLSIVKSILDLHGIEYNTKLKSNIFSITVFFI